MRRKLAGALALALAAGLLASLAPLGAARERDDARGARLEARLTGEREVPGPGDPDGSGRAWVSIHPGRGEVCFRVGWKRIAAPTAAHIHVGTPDVAGPIVVGLFMTSEAPDQPPTLPETIHAVKGCTDEVVVPEDAPFASPEALLRNIARRPWRYYVNVHNLDFPAGAIRGQLHR